MSLGHGLGLLWGMFCDICPLFWDITISSICGTLPITRRFGTLFVTCMGHYNMVHAWYFPKPYGKGF
jgi:hypothetical protein